MRGGEFKREGRILRDRNGVHLLVSHHLWRTRSQPLTIIWCSRRIWETRQIMDSFRPIPAPHLTFVSVWERRRNGGAFSAGSLISVTE